MSKIEVVTGPERRRRWSDEQKLSIVEEAFASEASVAEAARRAGVCTGQIYRWRKELCVITPRFARAIVAEPADRAMPAPIEIDFGDIRVRIAGCAPCDLVASLIKVLACR